MSTLIDGATYRAFYAAFKEKFIEKEFKNGKSPYGRGDDSPAIWKEKNPKTKNFLVLEIIEFCLKDEMYFYRQLSLIKAKPKTINSKALGKALEYMGYILPEDMQRSQDSWDDKAEVLLNQFRADALSKSAMPQPDPNPGNPALNTAKKCVEDFYKFLAIGKTKNAWDLLAPAFQNREVWEGNYERFHDGYSNTLALRNICVFNAVQTLPSLIECMVFYEDEVSTYPINRMQALMPMSIAELDDFVATVKKMQSDIEQKGGVGFENIPIRKLFDPTGTEYIWYECFFKGKELNKHFPKPHPEVVLRLCQCSCILEGDQWLIKNISPAKTYSIR